MHMVVMMVRIMSDMSLVAHDDPLDNDDHDDGHVGVGAGQATDVKL